MESRDGSEGFMSVVTDEQVEQFRREGHILLSGLIPEEVARCGEAAMWALLEMDPEDPETWSEVPDHAVHKPTRHLVQHQNCAAPDILACYTDEVLTALSELTGKDRGKIHSPKKVLTQNVFPCDEPWSHSRSHFDGGTNRWKFNDTFPIRYGVHSILYLSDGEPHGGGTFGWPGTHKTMRGLAVSNPAKYPYLYEVNSDMHLVDIGEPVELVAKCGDILFYRNFFVHAGSRNVGARPRFACRHGWTL